MDSSLWFYACYIDGVCVHRDVSLSECLKHCKHMIQSHLGGFKNTVIYRVSKNTNRMFAVLVDGYPVVPLMEE